MTHDTLRQWRQNLGLTQAQAAVTLGLSLRAYIYCEKGERPIPKMMALAVEAISGYATGK